MIKIRDSKPEDWNFISSSFYTSLQHGLEFEGMTKREKSRFRKHANALLEILKGKAKIKVVCSEEYEDLIVGFCIYEEVSPTKAKLWYCYTKQAYRRQGVAKLLLSTYLDHYSTVEVSFRTLAFHKITKKSRQGKLSEWATAFHDKIVVDYIPEY